MNNIGRHFNSLQEVINCISQGKEEEEVKVTQQIISSPISHDTVTYTLLTPSSTVQISHDPIENYFIITDIVNATNLNSTSTNDKLFTEYHGKDDLQQETAEKLDTFDELGTGRQPAVSSNRTTSDSSASFYAPVGRSDLNPLAEPGSGMYVGPDDEIFSPPSPSSSRDNVRPPGARFDPVAPFNPLGEPDPDLFQPPNPTDPLANPFPTNRRVSPSDKNQPQQPFGSGGTFPPRPNFFK